MKHVHVQAVERHPSSSVSLAKGPARGQRLRPIEGPDIVETKETALENVAAGGIFAVHPPWGEIRKDSQDNMEYTYHVKLSKSSMIAAVLQMILLPLRNC